MMHAVGVLALLSGVFVQEKDNLEYKFWSDFKVGSWVKFKGEIEGGGQKIPIEVTSTLKELTKEKAVVESASKFSVGGQSQEQKENEDIPAKQAKDSMKITKELGEEEIEVGGKKLKCRVVEAEEEKDGGKTRIKAWLNKDIPGNLAKAEVKMGEEGTVRFAATGWEKK